jgi:hypothetical protein
MPYALALSHPTRYILTPTPYALNLNPQPSTLNPGLEQVLKFLQTYRITEEQVAYIRWLMPNVDPNFFEWLRSLDCSAVKV